jgi:serpin B
MAACSSDDGGSAIPTEGGDEVRSEKQRILSPQVSDTDYQTQVAGNNGFGWAAYQEIRGEEGNLFFSPYSISSAFAMLYAGARGNTEAELADALQFVLSQQELHPVFNKLDLELRSRGQGKKAADGKAFRLNVVNATWGQRDYGFLQAYLDTLAVNYGAGLRTLDFAADPEASRQVINEWVEEQTEERIKDLLPEGSIKKLTRLVLTNAIYFNAAWAEAFEEKATQKAPFHLLDGQELQVDMMVGTKGASYTKGADFEAVSLPYDGGELSMLILLPQEGEFDAFEQTLSVETIDGIVGQLRGAEVYLKLPRFELEKTLPLKQTLMKMGIADVFGSESDLSGINGKKDLYVSDAFHKAFVKVNEAGTEAAAATAIVVGKATSIGDPQPPPIPVTVDRPFIFLIRDHATNSTLFIGRVVQP